MSDQTEHDLHKLDRYLDEAGHPDNGDARQTVRSLAAEFERLQAIADDRLTPDVFTDLVDWLRDPAKPAAQQFTAGITRQIAYALEIDVLPIVRQAKRRIAAERDALTPEQPTHGACTGDTATDVRADVRALTPELIDRCAQRLASWDDGCVWPDSWEPWQVTRLRTDAERVLREAGFREPAQPPNASDGQP
jgi:hypothetical protein